MKISLILVFCFTLYQGFGQSHNITLTTTTIGTGSSVTEEAVLTINCPTITNYVVEGNATLRAGEEIVLGEGFWAKTGSEFCATIEEVPVTFAELKKTLDASYELLVDDKYLNFTFDERYTPSTNQQLDFKVYDNRRNEIAVGTFSVVLGDNRYVLDASSMSAGFYTLEVTANKNKKYYLRFKKP